jgi:hypothetical protein
MSIIPESTKDTLEKVAEITTRNSEIVFGI